MRTWRKTHPLTPGERVKDNARSTARYYQRRGKLIPKPCEVCGAAEVVKHHPDYAKPLDVVWLCTPHHRAEHDRLDAARWT